MKRKSSSFQSLLKLWKNISKLHKFYFLGTCALSIFAAYLEALVIFTFIPFISNITGSSSSDKRLFPVFFDFINLDLKDSNYIIFLTFILMIFLSSFSRLIYIFLTTKTSAKIGSHLSKKVFKHLLYQQYIEHINRDSSYVIQMISSNITRAVGIISSVGLIVSSLLLCLAILSSLLITETSITLISTLLIIMSYVFIYRGSKGGLFNHGNIIRINEEKIIRLVRESLNSIREIIINNMYSKYLSKYEPIDIELRNNQAKSTFIAQYPRYIIEALMISIISSIAFVLAKNNTVDILPKLAVFALGFLRILPAIQQIYLNIANIKTFSPSLDAINSCLDIKSKNPIYTTSNISKKKNKFDLVGFNEMPIFELSNVSFKYPRNKEFTLSKVNLKLNKGLKYAIVGTTGSGKSTLQDLLLGLLVPTEGATYFKGLDLTNDVYKILYQSFIAHVPQIPLILNTSISDNIFFGSDKKDFSKLQKCLKDTMLDELVEKESLDYLCGEDGINLSGGQRQRIAIARALYSDKEILFLDECTSALDLETEEYILNSIFSKYKEKTILSITHKKNTYHLYDQIIKVKRNKLKILET